jgi:putative ABC transport system permease protein
VAQKLRYSGPTTSDDLFGVGATGVVGQKIRIAGIEYKIIGITVAKGGSGFSNADDVIYIPYTTAQRYISGNKYLSEIDVSKQPSSSLSTQVQNRCHNSYYWNRHNIADPTKADFNTLNRSRHHRHCFFGDQHFYHSTRRGCRYFSAGRRNRHHEYDA